MAKRRYFTKKRTSHKKSMTVPLAVVMGFAPVAANTFGHFRSNGLMGKESAISEASRTMIGYDPYDMNAGFQAWRLRYGLYPVVAGFVAHYAANKLGINRMLGRMRVPFVRI